MFWAKMTGLLTNKETSFLRKMLRTESIANALHLVPLPNKMVLAMPICKVGHYF